MELATSAESNSIGDVAVTIMDISRLGALIKTTSKLSIGSFVTLKIGDAMTFGGWIAWSKADSAGIDFAHPVPARVVKHLSNIRNEPDIG